MASLESRSSKYHLNKVHTLFELVLRRPSPTNVPIYCLHEPTTGCNLKCPACPTGIGLASLRETAELEDYEIVCREFSNYLDIYYLFNWGEPTMARSLVAILRRLRTEPFRVHMSSNFSVPLKDDVIEALATTPNLDLRINVDGATQESHQRYRVNSKLATIMSNGRKLADAIKVSATPPRQVYFGFLAFDYNTHEADEVAKMAEGLGFRFVKFDNPLVAGEPMPINNVHVEDGYGCTWLYSSISPSPKLSHIAPCCGVWDESLMSQHKPGRSLHETFMHEERYMERRTGDATFARLPKAEREAHLKNNLLHDEAMALKQRESKVDICASCIMGKAYQNKLGDLFNGAVASLAYLTKVDPATAVGRITKVLSQLHAQPNSPLYAHLVDALDMPPAADRNFSHYEKFGRFLLSVQ